MEKLLPSEIKRDLNTSLVGKEIFYYPRLDSTNNRAKELAAKGVREGSVVLAETQTRGRGRLGRPWFSPPGKDLLFSLIFYPKLEAARIFLLTMVASLAVAETLKKGLKLEVQIKWPNDVYIGGKKVCGILTELGGGAVQIAYAVVGIGLNVNLAPSQYPEIKDTATSLSQELGGEVSRLEILKALLEEIEKGYFKLQKGGSKAIRERWNKLFFLKGRLVKVNSSGREEKGRVKGVEEDGALILEDLKGEIKKIYSGDVTLIN